MPHLRFTRDKRGYENTYVVHSVGRRGKTQQRILYWFRTPPNIRVGRAALDEDAIRAIEDGNPDIVFDWAKILEAQPQPTPPPMPERRRRPRESQGPASPQLPPEHEPRPSAAHADVSTAEEPGRPQSTSLEGPLLEPSRLSDAIAADDSLAEIAEIADVQEIEPPALVPVTVYHGGADVLIADPPAVPRPSLVEAHLGSEQLSRIRGRYSEILARIREGAGSDPVRLEEWRGAADALNPDAWVTEAEIVMGLQQFDARLGEIRRSLGIKRRRRSRRGGRRRHLSGDAMAPAVATGKAPSSGTAAEALDESQAPNEVEDEAE